jgi:hypothetical protein
MLLKSSDGDLWPVDRALLAPKGKGWDPEFYWRPDLGYIAVKNGLMLEAIIAPETYKSELLRDLVWNLSGCGWLIGTEEDRNGETYEQEKFAAAGLPGDGADGLPPQRAEEDLRI